MEKTGPTILIISDSLGDTASDVALAAAAQFEEGSFRIVRFPKIGSVDTLRAYLGSRAGDGRVFVAFHTVVDPRLRHAVSSVLSEFNVDEVDVLGPSLLALSNACGCAPRGIPGVIHATDDRYFKRIEAMEYFVEHDDGRNCDDLSNADIVLLGISRTSKTPLSMYLAYLGYRVANIPLAPGMEPPASIFKVDPAKVFGLLSTVDIIAGIRDSRLGDDMSRTVAASYADPVAIDREMREARALMGRIGCIVVRTDCKAIEESASEIIGHLESVKRARAKRATGSSTQ